MSSPLESFDESSLPLPNEITRDCLALLPRRYYPIVSLVSKTMSSFISSTDLYTARSLLRSTENVLYVSLRFRLQDTFSWYSLNTKPFKDESTLVPLPSSFPSLPSWGSSFVSIGYEIYVFGGCIDQDFTSNVLVVDCRFHTWRFLPSMRVPRGCAAIGVVDGKVYVMGGCKPRPTDWIEVFDLKTQTWESNYVSCPCNEHVNEKTIKSIVMEDKICVMDRENSFVYDPKEKRWDIDTKTLNERWMVGSCVVDNLLYTFDGNHQIKVYDPNQKIWRVLKGVEDLHKIPSWSRMVNYGGKLAVVVDLGSKNTTEIYCTLIELERRQGDAREIWGKIVSSQCVLNLDYSSNIVKCLSVTI
ncbi:unnamed protein product [Cochlearia groenlandica]